MDRRGAAAATWIVHGRGRGGGAAAARIVRVDGLDGAEAATRIVRGQSLGGAAAATRIVLGRGRGGATAAARRIREPGPGRRDRAQDSKILEGIVLVAIFINAITLAATAADRSVDYNSRGYITQLFVWCVFVAECILKVAAHGLEYFWDPWNQLDFLVRRPARGSPGGAATPRPRTWRVPGGGARRRRGRDVDRPRGRGHVCSRGEVNR